MSDAASNEGEWIPLCQSGDLQEGGDAVPFGVIYAGQTCRAFAVRYEGAPYAYLNRCTHVTMELDFQPNKVFDDTGRWLLCATHGAEYEPTTGVCVGGPCRKGLVRIALRDHLGVTQWQTAYNLQPVTF